MVVLIILGIAGIIISACSVYVTFKILQLNISIKKDQKIYRDQRKETLKEISIHLYNLQHEDSNSNSEKSNKRDKEFRLLQSLFKYIKEYF